MTEPKKKIRSHFATGLRGRDTTFSESNAKKVVLSFARGASVSEHTLRECLVVLFPEAKANIREKAKDSKYTRLVNFLEENGTVTDLQVYAKFGMTFPQVKTTLKHTLDIITYTTRPHEWNASMTQYIFHYHRKAYGIGADDWKCPEGHTRIE